MNQIINPAVTSQSQYFPTVANDKLKQSQSGSKRSLNAKRLISTKQLDYQAWLEVRKQGIGSSDAAAACGINPYMSMLELWMIKTGRVQQNIDDESSGHAPLYWGKQLEPLVAEYYSMHTTTACTPIIKSVGSMRCCNTLILTKPLCWRTWIMP